MAHRSRLAGFIIDCETDDLDGAAAFWAAALGAVRTRAAGQVRALDPQARAHVEVQTVEHPSRVHLDIESDDIPRRWRGWSGSGRKQVAEVKTWVVMEAPTGHRFCVIRAQTRRTSRRRANTWEDAR